MTTRIVNEEFFTVKDSYYRTANWLEPVYEETIDGDKITRKYLKYCQDNGNFRFDKGDTATYKRKGKWSLSLHSFDDQPALVTATGSKRWFHEGFEHREVANGPQAIYASGVVVWDDMTIPGSRKIEYPEYPANYEHDCHLETKPDYFFGCVERLPRCCQMAHGKIFSNYPSDAEIAAHYVND